MDLRQLYAGNAECRARELSFRSRSNLPNRDLNCEGYVIQALMVTKVLYKKRCRLFERERLWYGIFNGGLHIPPRK